MKFQWPAPSFLLVQDHVELTKPTPRVPGSSQLPLRALSSALAKVPKAASSCQEAQGLVHTHTAPSTQEAVVSLFLMCCHLYLPFPSLWLGRGEKNNPQNRQTFRMCFFHLKPRALQITRGQRESHCPTLI